MKSYQQFAMDVQEELRRHPQWQDDFKRYMTAIETVAQQKKAPLPPVRVLRPLFRYTTIGNEGKTNTAIKSILRYQGQEVATITPALDGAYVTISEKQAMDNRCFFVAGEGEGHQITMKTDIPIKWNSPQGKEFRSFFNALPSKNNTNMEHTVESALLTELEKKLAKDKSLCGIRPVQLHGKRFQMKTALKASQSKRDICTYSSRGGGIDILARRKIGNRSYFVIIELKDENKPEENLKSAIKQAVAYGVFMRELLRSTKAGGEKWYHIFGFRGQLPTSLTMKCAVAMPNIKTADLFAPETLTLGQDRLELHWISINKTNGIVESHSDNL